MQAGRQHAPQQTSSKRKEGLVYGGIVALGSSEELAKRSEEIGLITLEDDPETPFAFSISLLSQL